MTTMQDDKYNKEESSSRGCPVGKVPIFKSTMMQQRITKSVSNSELEDFSQYSQSYPGHHVSGFN